jgi:prepilin-type processing-associated H-X9-DG protein
LFENISIAQVAADGVTYTSRTSLPSAPFTGAVDGGTAFTTTAVMTALLLPAVQQAREAARRTQSQNNLKMIMLALHNYHDTYQAFPEGTQPNEKLKPEERLSWQAKILPFLDQQVLFSQIDFEEGWEDPANAKALMTQIPVYRNPSALDQPSTYATTHYVGIAGLGKDGPELPATNPRAGVFAYDRATKIRDITDGTSNTIAVTDGKDHGPWGAGAHPTMRALTEKPYINGPDGIGGPHAGGINAALADGSVRFISENIDPTVFEALTTISGGEVVGGF